ncbi:MAG: CinA family protein [Chitinophagaceae bacterium]|nr:MAG: CinA family protein [Chitinophagaceae bacterium]
MTEHFVADFNDQMIKRGIRMVCAESVTAGLLASTIGSVQGASEVLIGSIVTYSRNLKTAVLDVDPRVIDQHTAESQQTTNEMAYGLTRLYPGAEVFVAVTGVASEPVGPYEIDKEVGQVYLSIYYKNTMHEHGEILRAGNNTRNEIRERAVELILEKILVLTADAL